MTDAGLSLPRLPADHRLQAILRKRVGAPIDRPAGHAHWDATRFGLDRAALFRDATPAQRAAILDGCGRALLEEAFFIEKVGVGFAAKMVLLAETTEERQLYGLFAADEATHLARVGGFLDGEPSPAGNPFLALLAGAIERGDRRSLQVLIQLVLEGWGLAHYADLAATCRTASLRATLESIVQDEAAHHGSGVVLCGEPGALDQPFLTDVLTQFLAMVAAGPQGVVGVVERVLGHLSPAQRLALFEDLDAERHSDERLRLLRRLMAKAPAAGAVAARLADAGSFTAWSARRCA